MARSLRLEAALFIALGAVLSFGGALGCSELVEVGQDSEADGGRPAAEHEECANGIDDDFDGTIDEGCWCAPGETQTCYPGAHRTRGFGACFDGIQQCVTHGGEEFGQWGETCDGGGDASRELCDGRRDEDCDGAVDEGCACREGAGRECGPTAVGLCSPGEQRCREGRWTACVGATFPAPETCGNARDEDCDGEADEGCGCVPEPEQCHSGVDEDCDGVVDEPSCDPRRPPCGGTWFRGEVCTTDCWCWREPRLPITEYRGLWGDGAGGLWAVGGGGVFVRRSGGTWSGASGLVPGGLLDVSGSGPEDVWAVGEDGAIVHWDGSELTVRRLSGGSASRARGDWLHSVWASSPTDVWAGGPERVLRYDGTEWRDASLVVEGTVRDIWAASQQDVWLVESVRPGAAARLHRWNGDSFRSEALPTTEQVEGIWGTGPEDVWIVARDGVALHFDGSAFQRHDFPGQFRDVHGSQDAVWAVTERQVVRWDEGASSWRPQAVPGPFDDANGEYAALRVSDSGAVSVVGRGGMALRREGGSWHDLRGAALSFGHVRDVWRAGPEDVWAVGLDGAVARWQSGGWSTVAVPNAGSADWTVVDGTGPGNVWLGATEPARTAHWDGRSWETFERSARDLTVVSGDLVWVAESTASAPGRLWRWNVGSWEPVAAPDGVTPDRVWASGPDDLWVTGSSVSAPFVLFRWDGTGWSAVDVPCESHSLTGFGPDDVWVGSCHWDGGAWTQTRQSGDALFGAASAAGVLLSGASRSVVWSTSWTQSTPRFAFRWNGVGWQREITGTGAPVVTGAFLPLDGLRPYGLHASDPEHVWIAGDLSMGSTAWAPVRGFVVRDAR